MATIETNIGEERSRWVESLFADIDGKKIDSLVARFDEAATMTFGNAEPLRGKDEIRAANEAFLGSIEAISHRLTGLWEFDGTVIARLQVTYSLPGGQVFELPSCSVVETEGETITSYQVFFDPSPVMAAS